MKSFLSTVPCHVLFKKCYDDLTKRTWTVQCNVQFTVRLSVKGAEQSPQRLTLALLHEKKCHNVQDGPGPVQGAISGSSTTAQD